MGFSFNRISDFFVLVVVVVVLVVYEVLHERGFSELRASRAKKEIYLKIKNFRASGTRGTLAPPVLGEEGLKIS